MSEQPQSVEPLGSGLEQDDVRDVQRLHDSYRVLRSDLEKVIVGQSEVIEQLLIALFSRGHVILEGVPGLAKTLMISSLAQCLGLKFNRIQFMPDLMPADITGTEVIQEDRRTGSRSFRFLAGPIFANVLLADEINRTPPKTQAALLEAMQEGHVTVGGVRNPLDPPFFVLATQNPIEQEGTYPLPEAQQDRFMFKVFVDYPSYDEEYRIAERTTRLAGARPVEVLQREEILRLQSLVRRIPAPPAAMHYALELVRLTRPLATLSRSHHQAEPQRSAYGRRGSSLELIDRFVTFGAGPRAVQFLVLGAKARAAIHGRLYVSEQDVRALAHAVLRHRLITNYAAEAEGYDPDRVIDHVLDALPMGALGEHGDAALEKVLGR